VFAVATGKLVVFFLVFSQNIFTEMIGTIPVLRENFLLLLLHGGRSLACY